MRNELPAAIPLTFVAAGIGLAPFLLSPRSAAFAVACCGALFALLPITASGTRRWRDAAIAMFALASGLFVMTGELGRREAEEKAFASLDPERFVSIALPLERGWVERDESWTIRASHFAADGKTFDAPISVSVGSPPPVIAMEASLHVEATLRRARFEGYSARVKAPQLMRLDGQLRWWDPAAWNRTLALRLAVHAQQFPSEVALAEALLLGRGERLTRELRESFRRGGTYHLLVFSGLQIAAAAGLLALLLRWLRAPRASDWMLLLFALLAPPFIGPTASVSRASLAIGLYALSRIARRPTSAENLWCVAALLRLLVVPSDLLDPSFHLTYGGAGALLFLAVRRAGQRPQRIAQIVGMVVAAEVVITPITLYHFNQYALGGAVVTLLMSPLIFAMLLVSAAACAVPVPVVFRSIGLMHRACEFLNGYGFAGSFAAPPVATMIAGAALALMALCFVRPPRRAILIYLALLIPSSGALVRSARGWDVDPPQMLFFDVGQGDATAIRAGRETLLFDGGPGRRVLPLLANRGVVRVSAALVTHAHPDHCGGVAEAIRDLFVERVYVYPRLFRGECAQQLLAAASETATPLFILRDGDRLQLAPFSIDVIAPGMTFRRAAENNGSVLFRASAGGTRLLVTGDVEKEAELYHSDRDLTADVVKVPHHGGRSSTSTGFIDQVKPRVAVVSCGRENPFGHPHPSLLKRLAEWHIRTYRTDLEGTVTITAEPGGMYVESAFD